MRTITFIVTFILITMEVAFSQFAFPDDYPTGPFPAYSPSRITGLYSVRYYSDGEEVFPVGGMSDGELIRSKDGLTDTISYMQGVRQTDIYSYSEKNLLLSYKSLVIHDLSQLLYPTQIDHYEYDNKDRIIKKTTYLNEVEEKNGEYITNTRSKSEITYDYEQNIVTFYDRFYHDDSESIRTFKYSFTETGYIEDTGEKQTEYTFDEKNRLTKISDSYSYVYHDNGYARFYDTDWELEPVKEKKDFIFDEKGYLEEVLFLKKGEMDDDWQLYYWEEYSYNGFIVSNQNIEQSSPSAKVYGTDGGIIIETHNPTTLVISTVTGQLVLKKTVDSYEKFVPVSQGLYIVNVGQESYKILVK